MPLASNYHSRHLCPQLITSSTPGLGPIYSPSLLQCQIMKDQQQVILQRSQTDFLCLDPALAFWIFPHALPLSDSCWFLDFWTSTPACDLALDFSPAPLVPLPGSGSPGFDPCPSDQVLSFAPAAYLSETLILTPVPGLRSAAILQGSCPGSPHTIIQWNLVLPSHPLLPPIEKSFDTFQEEPVKP
ncbi:uncharacterized protein LOC112450883 isoform X2 [Kryptolebias marmoratus]|uniref:uncharacterized protein LOC112450883 isoform X2 n=1 Tax=Kryptolebias marmoratus TaxID=37003 RepID=UPI0018ACFAA3|nr:uncharacterized protein LOC112450883 isoform X2 [Kryptolebias marmoratus]